MSASKSPMVKWYFVCPAEDIPLREGRCVTFENHRVALFRLGDGNVRAVQNTCPHKEGPLADGMVFGETVTCPLHTRTFDLRTGAGVNEGDGQLRVYPTRIVDGRVLIAFDDIPDRIRPEFVIKSSSYFKVTAVIRSAGWPAAKQALEDIGCTSYARYRVLGRGEQQGLSVQQQQQALVPEMPSGPAADWRHAWAVHEFKRSSSTRR